MKSHEEIQPAHNEMRALEPPRLVFAEDDDEIRTALAELFSRDGFDVTTVSDGKRLIECLTESARNGLRPDIIITDHRMPGYTALDVLAQLRSAEWNVPVIVITAFGWEVRHIAGALGARAVFEKPFDPDDLRTAVLYWVDWVRGNIVRGDPPARDPS